MEPTQVKQLFIDLFGKKIDVYGLSVALSNVEFIETLNIYEFNFNIINPYDVSYYITPVEWEIQELIDEFNKYVDVRINSNIFLNTNQGELYFNQEKTKEIENSFKQVDTIKFTTGTPFIGYKRYELKIKSVGYKKYFRHEQIQLDNVSKPISATKNGDPCDLDEAIIQYYEEFLPQNETYWESENIYQHLDQVLSSIPSIGNNDILLSYSTTLSRK
jgi:hypothetical protein